MASWTSLVRGHQVVMASDSKPVLQLPPELLGVPGSSVGQSFSQRRGPAASLPPALQSWIDNVMVPALVREYLDKNKALDKPE